jgi:hypothetical protein
MAKQARSLGRVDDEEWRIIKEAAFAAGMSFTEWAMKIMLAQAAKVAPKSTQKTK